MPENRTGRRRPHALQPPGNRTAELGVEGSAAALVRAMELHPRRDVDDEEVALKVAQIMGELTKQERFAHMVAYMDAAVGRIEDGLAELGVLENTLLLFVGDNGTDRAIRSMQNGREIKGGKAHSTDAGTHVPMIISRPGTIAPGTCDDLVDLSDFWPTLAEAIGVSIEDGLDGRSFLPQLLGEPGDPRDVLTMYSNPRPPGTKRNPRVRFARDKRYKLYDDGRFFDTQADPDEAHPLEHGQVTRVLREMRAGLQRALDAMPREPAHLLP